MEYRIDNTFELLSQEEWNKNLGSVLFENMIIDLNVFQVEQDYESQIVFENIGNYIRQHNNKVGSLKVSYSLCRHYFDKGIPDDPWYISPGKEGQSVQYMPEFKPEDWMKRYWFSFFSEIVYFKLFSIWDSVIYLIKEYYQLEKIEKKELKYEPQVMKSLESQRSDIVKFIYEIKKKNIFKYAKDYRNKIIHIANPNDVSSKINIKRNFEGDFTDINEDGTFENKKVNISVQISEGIGEYITTKTIMDNIEGFSEFIGNKISEIINMIKVDTFSFKL